MRASVVAACLSLCLIGFSSAQDAHASVRKETNIPAEGLGPALGALAKDRNFQIVYVTEEIANVQTQGAVGEFTTDEALKRLLTGTGLTYRYLDDKTVTIGSAATPQERGGSATSSGPSDDPNANQEGKKSSSSGFRVAQVDQTVAGPRAVGGQKQNSTNDQSGGPALTEIVVTAQKREERVQDVPVPVSVINTDALVSNNQVLLQDYYTSVPGLNISPYVQSSQDISIRGVTTGGATNPTVGVLVDDVPFGGSTNAGGGRVIPDFDPGDLNRIEVLRGPQGVLYGASSMGGLIKFVTVDPSTDALSGHVEVGGSGVENGDSAGYNLRGSVNLPVNNELAVRVSGFTRKDPGYIDDPTLREQGVNEDHVSGGYLSALWKASDALSLKLSALYQDSRAEGSSDVDVLPNLSGLEQSVPPGVGAYDRKVQAYSAVLKAKLGDIDLTSVTGYNINSYSDSFDASPSFGGVGGFTDVNYGVTGAPLFNSDKTDKVTQEIRLSGSFLQHFDWLVGGFYTHESSEFGQQLIAENAVTGVHVADAYFSTEPSTYQEYAGFGALTYHFTDQFDIQVGARESKIDQSSSGTSGGKLLGGVTTVAPTLHSSASPYTYLATPRFRINEDLMVYARFASGYRAGGANPPGIGVPAEYRPDTTKDYEVGLKADFFNHVLSIDTSAYYISWTNIQIDLYTPSELGYTGNGSKAKSQGLEFSAESRPVTGLRLAGWVDFSDAELTEPFPPGPAYGATGEPLPLSSRFSAHLSADQQFPLTSAWTGFVGGEVSYQGNRLGEFSSSATAPRQYYPAYARTDLHAGVISGPWTVTAYTNNVTDKRGLLGGGLDYFPSYAFQYIQPRTFGVSLVRKF